VKKIIDVGTLSRRVDIMKNFMDVEALSRKVKIVKSFVKNL
jgi:hypothetical protein